MRAITAAILSGSALLGTSACVQPEWGANAILHPHRRAVVGAPGLPHRDVSFSRDGVTLKGWYFPTTTPTTPSRPLLVYLHGSADNRQSGLGIAQRFGPKGYDVLTYDGRAHGESGGAACTYGVLEKHDLVAALDAVGAQETILFGSSLGAAVALQAAPIEPRVRGVIAQSSFSSLRQVVQERARWLRLAMPRGGVVAALDRAGQEGAFSVDEASPLLAAPGIRVPVLLIHGAKDRDTRPEHSKELDHALTAPHRLILVPGAGHNDVLGREEVWREIEGWLAMI